MTFDQPVDPEGPDVRRCSALPRSVSCLATLVLIAVLTLSMAHASPTERSPAVQLSQEERASLKELAVSRPCAAMALLLIWRVQATAQKGAFQFEGVPSRNTLELFLDKSDGSAFDGGVALLRGPYSTLDWYVEVRWTLDRVDSTHWTLKTHAILVDQFSTPLDQLIEPPTTVSVSESGYRIVKQGG